LHGDLNFFVGSRTRSGKIERILAEKTSVKDVIESCGVPHPEVDLILVNGRAVAFDYGVEYTAEVEVFPVHTQDPHFEKNRLQVRKWQRFMVDGHLGKLARNLRLLGFDVAYDREAQDQQLLQIMAS